MRHRVHTWAAAAAAAVAIVAVVATVATGRAARAPGDEIEVAALNFELASVVRLDQLRQGFEFDVHAACTATNASQFSCRVDAIKPGYPVNSWDETVTCGPPGDGSTYRCATESGYVLQ
jgi:hypothetical protein